MSIDYQFRPISQWPGQMHHARSRRRATFKADYNSTLRLLQRELEHLGASKVVIEAAFPENAIRLDGRLREGCRPPEHPGIILSFQSNLGPLRYPCDTFDDWRANLRAIALGLEALRRVDRYGVTRRGEQYSGWKQLPSAVTAAMTVEQAAEVLVRLAMCDNRDTSFVMKSAKCMQECYRTACKATHPDLNGGKDDDFKLLQECKRVLDAHHGL